ncbi:E3 ubiquitin-protein ligase TRIM21-like isoform 2-T2 [Anomaloglossus baeobatrachus]|uniref:E3 ubiquitin-protein ligase TRIM21-like n=1 Tax=Anomaloglossus baeobatrachus TaxID=238106 RepID=UPI003F4FF4AF
MDSTVDTHLNTSPQDHETKSDALATARRINGEVIQPTPKADSIFGVINGEDASTPPQTSHQDNPLKEEKKILSANTCLLSVTGVPTLNVESPSCLVLQENEESQVLLKRTYLQEAAWKLFQDYEKQLHTMRFNGNLHRERLKESFHHVHRYLENEKETRIAKQGDSVQTSIKDLESRVHSLLSLSTSITNFLIKLEKGEMVNETTEHLKKFQDQLKEMSKFSVPLINHISPYHVQEWRGIRHIVKPMEKTLHFNPISANPNLFVSQNLKQVRYTSFPQARYTNTFFEPGLYVLGMPGFRCGEHYWEVDVGHKTNWILGIVKDSVPLKGPHILSNDHGFLVVRKQGNNMYYGCDLSVLKLTVSPMRIGVFVDVFSSYIAFYNADTTELISEMSGWKSSGIIFPFFCPGVPIKEEDLVPLSLS